MTTGNIPVIFLVIFPLHSYLRKRSVRTHATLDTSRGLAVVRELGTKALLQVRNEFPAEMLGPLINLDHLPYSLSTAMVLAILELHIRTGTFRNFKGKPCVSP